MVFTSSQELRSHRVLHFSDVILLWHANIQKIYSLKTQRE